MRTTVTFDGSLVDDPQVRFTPSGKQVPELIVLVNQRRQNSDGEWASGSACRGQGAGMTMCLTSAM
jgi:single-strand DNA-binding protein